MRSATEHRGSDSPETGSVHVFIGEECIKCGLCLDRCPARAIAVNGGRYRVGGDCVGCLACLEVCPADAVRPVAEINAGRPDEAGAARGL